jgi:Glyoxalase superfamily protein
MVNVSRLRTAPLPERTGQQRKHLTPCFVQAKDDNMRDFRDAKAMAHTLRAALAARDIKITNSQSLELIAETFGAADWNTLSAAIRAAAEPPNLPRHGIGSPKAFQGCDFRASSIRRCTGPSLTPTCATTNT